MEIFRPYFEYEYNAYSSKHPVFIDVGGKLVALKSLILYFATSNSVLSLYNISLSY
jgi:hypothetical protein